MGLQELQPVVEADPVVRLLEEVEEVHLEEVAEVHSEEVVVTP